MHRAMHRHEVGVGRLEPTDTGRAPVRRAGIHDPENPVGVPVRGLGHDLGDQSLEGHDAGGSLAAAEHPGVMHVEGGEVGPGPTRVYSCSTRADRPGLGGTVGCRRSRAWTLVFSSALITKSSACRGWPSHSRAYRSRIRLAFAAKSGSRGKIQARCCQGRMASSWSHRHTVLPAQRGDEARALHLLGDVGAAQARQRQPARGGQLTREGLDLDERFLLGGKARGRPGRGRSSRPGKRS